MTEEEKIEESSKNKINIENFCAFGSYRKQEYFRGIDR